MNIRIAFRVQEQRDVDLILGQGMLKAGWHANKLNAPRKIPPLVTRAPHPPRLPRHRRRRDRRGARYAPARPQLDTISRLALTEGPPAPQPPAEPSPRPLRRRTRRCRTTRRRGSRTAGPGRDPQTRAVRRARRRHSRQRPHHGHRHEPAVGLLPATPARRRWLRRPDGTRPLAHREMTIRNRECKVQVHTLTRVCTYSGTIGSCTCTSPPPSSVTNRNHPAPSSRPLRGSDE